jgi:2,4-dienoyl-CoA reductase-like NADH-dependent reductase (Old Yellow Enzyme family)
MLKANQSITFPCGVATKNRFMLAPMTNQQSHEDGSLSDEEFNWLTKRAEGGFGMVMTCASHVQQIGKGFSGQLGIFSDTLNEGHRRLTKAIKSHGSLALIQLHHAGMRSPKKLIGESPICPSDNEEFGARAMHLEEVHQLRDDFVTAAKRAQQCGYDGVEVHGAHGYIISQFLSAAINHRYDAYGGSLENRSRLLFEIVDGIRQQCGKEFLLGVRLSPERFGMNPQEVKEICLQLVNDDRIDFLDISLWDYKKLPEDEHYQDKSLLNHFTELDLKEVKLTVAGKIRNAEDVQNVLNEGVDFVTIGRSAILHHNFPELVSGDDEFIPTKPPVSRDYLRNEGLGEAFIDYMTRWKGFVK